MYRLTLVKEWNTEELESYAALVQKGNPDFIEVKVSSLSVLLLCMWCHSSHTNLQGVTYCGDSKASNITMANIPWHEEVRTVSYLVITRVEFYLFSGAKFCAKVCGSFARL